MKQNKIIIFLVLLFSFTQISVFTQDNSEQKQKEEEKQSFDYNLLFKDLRRFEIISLGSMPFITLDVTLGYTIYKSCVNGFDTSYFNVFSSKNYSKKEITGILVTSACVSVGIAVTDYVINIIKRNKTQKKNKEENPIDIYPIDLNLFNDSNQTNSGGE